MNATDEPRHTRAQHPRRHGDADDPFSVAAMLSAPSTVGPDAVDDPAPALPFDVSADPGFTSGTVSDSVPVTHGGRTYRLRTGDDLLSVAKRFGVSVPALVELNGLKTGSKLRPGQILSLPEQSAPQAPAAVRVRPGDTLEGIAADYRVSVASLRRANALPDDAVIVVGELLSLTGTGAMSRRPQTDLPDELPRVAALSRADLDAYPAEVVRAARINKHSVQQRRIPSRRAARDLVENIAGRSGVDVPLALAVAQQESGFHHGTVSAGNAIGVMQVTPSAAHAAGRLAGRRLDVLDAADNITAGVRILGYLLEHSSTPREAVEAYYQGRSSIEEHGAYDDTARFADSVLVVADRLRSELFPRAPHRTADRGARR